MYTKANPVARCEEKRGQNVEVTGAPLTPIKNLPRILDIEYILGAVKKVRIVLGEPPNMSGCFWN